MTPTKPKTARPPRGERARLIMDTATWCYLGALAVAAWHLWSVRAGSLPLVFVVLAVPSGAALLYLLASILVPSLHAPGRIVFPLNVTLPAVFTAMLLLCAVLGSHIGSWLIESAQPVRAIGELGRWQVLAAVYIAGCALLTLASMRKPPSEPDSGPTVDSA